MGTLVKLAERLSSKRAPLATETPLQKEPSMPKKVEHSPATRKQKGWVYYNLNLKTYGITISRKDMGVLIERSQRSAEEKAKVKHRLLQMGAKEAR